MRIYAVFTARRVCIARTMPSQDVCLPVCSSVCHTPVFCRHRWTYPQKFFLVSGSPIILVFPYQTGWQYSDGNPLTGASNATGIKEITIFDQYLALSRKWCKIETSYYGSRIGNRTKVANSTSLNDLGWPLTQILRSRYYLTSNNLKMVQYRAMLTMADQ